MYSMMLSLLGEFDFWELYQIAPVVAPFLFVSYVLLCVIVALNVLIGQHPCACFVRACLSSPCHVAPGIITAAFDNAKEEIENAPARPIVGELYNCTSAVQHASAMASHRSRRCAWRHRRHEHLGKNSRPRQTCPAPTRAVG